MHRVAPQRANCEIVRGREANLSGKLEREVKLRFETPAEERAAIHRSDARPLRPRRLQDDALLDTTDGLLRGRGCALRVRVEGERGHLTFKGPVQPSTVKVREEQETTIGDPDIMLRMLGELGFDVWFRYQKYREEFACGELIIALDETPIGTFVELEGTEGAIAETAKALGRTGSHYMLESYHALYADYRRAKGLAARHMLFDEVD